MMDYNAPGWLILTAEAYAVHEPWLKERFNDYGELLRDRLAFGALLRATDYVQAIRRRRVLCEEMRDAMADLDILITASAPAEAPKINEVPKWAHAGEAQLHHAVQPDRAARAERLHRLRRRRPAGQHADHRQAVRRGDRVPRRPRLRNGDRLAQQAPGDVDRSGEPEAEAPR